MGLSEVSNILWRQRQLLELLLFKLEEEQLVLKSGSTRWLAHATREVETVLAEIKRVELDRAVEIQAAAEELGFTDAPTLKQLTELGVGPWGRIFEEHRKAILELAQEIDSMAQSNRDLIARGRDAAHQTLISLGELDPETYSAQGTTEGGTGRARLVNEAM
jgi:hypothetical protein